MNTTNKIILIIALAIAVVVFLLFGSGAMTGTMMSGGMMGGMMGSGAMAAVSWMWIPTLVIVGLGVALCWVIFARKK